MEATIGARIVRFLKYPPLTPLHVMEHGFVTPVLILNVGCVRWTGDLDPYRCSVFPEPLHDWQIFYGLPLLARRSDVEPMPVCHFQKRQVIGRKQGRQE